jgi:hypothetical protein
LLPLALPSLLPASLVVVAIAHVIAATVAIALLAVTPSEFQSKMIFMGHQILSCHVPVVGSFFIL